MALRKFIKENFVLAVGLTLPLLLVALFFFASVVPKAAATPPQYDLVFSISKYEQSPPPYNTDFVVKDGRLTAHVSRNNKQHPGYSQRRIMLYDGRKQSVRELPYDLSKVTVEIDGEEVVFEEFKDMKLSDDTQAPDGYAFDSEGYNSGGLVLDIFGGHKGPSARVSKGAVSFKIPASAGSNTYYYDIQFLGWVLK